MSGIIRGAILLHLLCFWTQSCVDAIDPNVMASIIRDIRAVANINNQYSFAVVLPQHECNHQGAHDFVDDPGQIHQQLNTGQNIYVGQRVIAARPLFRVQGPTDHSEYRLLVTNNLGVSLMSELINRWQLEASCTVFFTLNSPCGTKCADPGHRFRILQYLNVFTNLDHNWVAFVFQDLFHYDRKTNRKQMLQILTNINIYGGNVPVYRCPLGGNTCYDCMAEDDPAENPCLFDMPKHKY